MLSTLSDISAVLDDLSIEELHDAARDIVHRIAELEPEVPTDGVLQRSQLVDATIKTITPLQHRYAGLLKDAFNDPTLRATVGLEPGKTPFRDANDFLAKTHGLRGFEATGRLKIAAAMTPVRASDPDRADDVAVGQTKLPRLGKLQATGAVHPAKLSAALNMLEAIDQNAEAVGKSAKFRDRLRTVVEKDLVEKIEHSTPEEFSRYTGRRKRDLLAALDSADKQFTQKQTDAMHNVWCEGPVRGNQNAHKWVMIVDAEAHEAFQTIQSVANNPRAKDQDGRSRGQRSMHAFRDAIKLVLANLDKSQLRGATGGHTQMVVVADYSTLIEGLRSEIVDLLPELAAEKREQLLAILAERERCGVAVPQPPKEVTLPPPKTTSLPEILDDDHLDRLQPQISQGLYTSFLPPEVALRLHCFVGVTPVTLIGDRQILSIGRESRRFPDNIRRAILARDRGCAVPGCHWPAAWCELHHIEYWSQNGEISTANGVLVCAHHHQALHAKMLALVRENGQIKFKLHPLVDPAQRPRQNYFWQS